MLQGKARCMTMELKGLEIPKGFKPRLVKQRRCRLKLPENWFNEFSGFLFCCVWKKCSLYDSVKITMRQEGKQQLHVGMEDCQDEQVFWEEHSFDLHGVNLGFLREILDFHTWMGYVSFGSLSRTTWWDKTSTAVDVSIDPFFRDESFISGFGVRLVSKTNQMVETTTSTNNSSTDDDYKFNVLHDSRSRFECLFKPRIRQPKLNLNVSTFN